MHDVYTQDDVLFESLDRRAKADVYDGSTAIVRSGLHGVRHGLASVREASWALLFFCDLQLQPHVGQGAAVFVAEGNDNAVVAMVRPAFDGLAVIGVQQPYIECAFVGHDVHLGERVEKGRRLRFCGKWNRFLRLCFFRLFVNTKQTSDQRFCRSDVFRFYLLVFLVSSTIALNTFGCLAAMVERTLRSSSMPVILRALMSLL